MYMMKSSVLALMPGMIKTRRMERKVGARMTDNSSDLVLDIWAMISLQQMLEKTVPVRKNMHLGSRSRMLLGDQQTQMKNRLMAVNVDTRGLTASKKLLFFPVP